MYMTDWAESTNFSPAYNGEIPLDWIMQHAISPEELEHPEDISQADMAAHREDVRLAERPWKADKSTFLRGPVTEGRVFVLHADATHFGPAYHALASRAVLFTLMAPPNAKDDTQAFQSNFMSRLHGAGSPQHRRGLLNSIEPKDFLPEERNPVYSEAQLQAARRSVAAEFRQRRAARQDGGAQPGQPPRGRGTQQDCGSGSGSITQIHRGKSREELRRWTTA